LASENFGECLVLNLDLVDLRRGKLLELRSSFCTLYRLFKEVSSDQLALS